MRYTHNRNVRKLLQGGKYVELATQLEAYETSVKSFSGEKKILMESLLLKWEFKSIDDLGNMVKCVEGMKAEVVAGMSPKQLRVMAGKLGKEVSTLKTAEQMATKIDEIKKVAAEATKPIKWAPEATAELLESQKKINQLITDDINAINKRLTDPTAPDFVKKTDPLYDVYDQQIKTLDKFRGEVKTFDAIEAEHFINLRMDYNFKTQYIIELHEIRKTSAFESAYEEALKKAGKAAGEEDFEIMVKVVKQLKWENRPGLIITEKLIESLEKEIRPAVKFLKSADEFFLLLKGVLRPVSKVLKWV